MFNLLSQSEISFSKDGSHTKTQEEEHIFKMAAGQEKNPGEWGLQIPLVINNRVKEGNGFKHLSVQFWLTNEQNLPCMTIQDVRDDFKTQPPVDRQFDPVPAGFYCPKQW